MEQTQRSDEREFNVVLAKVEAAITASKQQVAETKAALEQSRKLIEESRRALREGKGAEH